MNLVIQNDGEISVDALRLMGGSTKDGQDKIGIFGTGCKYALARALDLGIGVRIFSGVEEIPIRLRDITFRDSTFKELIVGPYDTGITTRLGVDWEPWFIVREFLCNAIDEGGMSYDIARGEVAGCSGKTRVYLEMTPEIRAVYDNFETYFRFGCQTVMPAPDNGELLVYRKGILIRQLPNKKALYSYQFDKLPINEARVLKSEFEFNWQLANFWKGSATEHMIARLCSTPESFELKMDWSYGGGPPSIAWEQALKDKTIIPVEMAGFYCEMVKRCPAYLPRELCLWLGKHFPKLLILGIGSGTKSTVIKRIEVSAFSRSAIDKAVAFLKSCGMHIAEVEIAELDSGVLGTVLDGKIILSPVVLERGQREIIKTVFEEQVHLNSGAQDCTREFQEAVLSATVEIMSRLKGVYL